MSGRNPFILLFSTSRGSGEEELTDQGSVTRHGNPARFSCAETYASDLSVMNYSFAWLLSGQICSVVEIHWLGKPRVPRPRFNYSADVGYTASHLCPVEAEQVGDRECQSVGELVHVRSGAAGSLRLRLPILQLPLHNSVAIARRPLKFLPAQDGDASAGVGNQPRFL